MNLFLFRPTFDRIGIVALPHLSGGCLLLAAFFAWGFKIRIIHMVLISQVNPWSKKMAMWRHTTEHNEAKITSI